MLNKFRRLFRKYPVFSSLVVGAILAFCLERIGAHTPAHWLLFIASALVLIPALRAISQTLRHGYYGIDVLPVIGLVFALLLRHYWTAMVLALIICSEKPLLKFLEKRHHKAGEHSKSVNSNSLKHAPVVRLLDRYSVPFTILIFLIAGAVWVISSDMNRFLEVIAITSTAPLLLAPSLALLIGLHQTNTSGIVVKSATLFEKLASTGSIVFKRSGVLINETSVVHEIKAYGSHNKTDVLQTAAALAADSSHHLARAIVAASSKVKINKAKHTREVQNLGIAGRMRGQNLFIGRLSFLEESGVNSQNKIVEPSETTVYVAAGNTIIGHITFAETLLPGANKLVKRLKKLGIGSVSLASGASDKPVALTAKQTGITNYAANCSAADKINYIERSTPKPVAYVGDGLSDTASLTAADISISNDQTEGRLADVVIPDYSIEKLITGFQVSRRSLRRAYISSLLGIFITLALVALSSGGMFTSLQSAGLQALTTLITLLLVSSTKKLKAN